MQGLINFILVCALIALMVYIWRGMGKADAEKREQRETEALRVAKLNLSGFAVDEDGRQTTFSQRSLSENTAAYTSKHDHLFVVVTAEHDENQSSVAEEFAIAGKALRNTRRKDVIFVPNKYDSPKSIKLVDSRTVVRGNRNDLFRELDRQDMMLYNLSLPSEEQRAASQRGLEVEAQAIADARRHLPSGWALDSNVILAENGDCDLFITSPDRRSFAIDIKSRRGPPDLQASEPDRNKSWDDIHAQIDLAARQLQGKPVLWLPTGDARNTGAFGKMTYVSGSAEHLYRHLASLY